MKHLNGFIKIKWHNGLVAWPMRTESGLSRNSLSFVNKLSFLKTFISNQGNWIGLARSIKINRDNARGHARL